MARCRCGGTWQVVFNAVDPVRGHWLDRLRVRCGGCGAKAQFTFDVTTWFVARPGVWNRRSEGAIATPMTGWMHHNGNSGARQSALA